MASTRQRLQVQAPAPRKKGAAVRWGRPMQGAEVSEQKRIAILKMAAQLFNEKGFYETSLNDLAARLHVTKPSLYYYISGKDDILFQILSEAMLEIDPAITSAERDGSNGMAKLRIFISRYVVFLTGDFGKCLALSGRTPLEENSRRRLAPLFRRIDSGVREMIQEGIDDASIAPCDVKIAAFTLFGAMHWICTWHQPAGDLRPEQIADRVTNLLELGFRPRQRAAAVRKVAARSAKAR